MDVGLSEYLTKYSLHVDVDRTCSQLSCGSNISTVPNKHGVANWSDLITCLVPNSDIGWQLATKKTETGACQLRPV